MKFFHPDRCRIINIFLVSICLFVLIAPSFVAAWTIGFLTGSGGLGDESFNDMTYKGLGQTKEKLGLHIKVREWEQYLSMEKLFIELIEEKSDIIVLNGDQFQPLIEKYALQFKTVKLIANDFDAGYFPNVKSIVYSQHEGSFLAGALAGSFSETKKIAFIGAIDIAVIKAFQTGFIEGVKYVSPSARISVEYISHYPDFSGFNNPKTAYIMATSLYDKGVDVIFAVAGMSGNGIIQAAKNKQKYVIGVDSDQDHMAKGFVLTSVMKRLDVAVYTEVIKAYEGKFKAGTVWYGLENGGISLTSMRYTKDIIPLATQKKLHSLELKIINGEIAVTNTLSSSTENSPILEKQ